MKRTHPHPTLSRPGRHMAKKISRRTVKLSRQLAFCAIRLIPSKKAPFAEMRTGLVYVQIFARLAATAAICASRSGLVQLTMPVA